MITHVVFDFDGTLVDSREAAIRLYNEIADRHGYGRLTGDNLEQVRGLSVLARCRLLGVPPSRLPALVVEVGREYRRAAHSIRFVEGVPELLQELRQRELRLAILSTNDTQNIRVFLERNAASTWVDHVVCSSALFGKGRLLRALMRRLRLLPEQLVYVGDEHRDVEACRQAGVRSIAAGWGFDSRARLQEAGPDFFAERPADVAECIERWRVPPRSTGSGSGPP